MLPYLTPPSGGGLYIIRLSDTHYYGGRAVCFATRWYDHLRNLQTGTHTNSRMQRVFNKHGKFSPEIVRVLDRDIQTDAEQAWLNEHHGKPGCVNISPHATGGNFIEWTPEMRQRLSEAHKGQRLSAASIEKRRQTVKSRPDLVEKARESLARNRVHVDATARNRKTGEKLRGRKQDPEAVAKRAASNRGRKNTPDTLRRMSESAKRRAQAQPTSHGGETRALISAQQRGRVWVNDGRVNQRLFPEEADRLLACGWGKGRVSRR